MSTTHTGRRTARQHTHYVPTGDYAYGRTTSPEYTVEVRQGSASWTQGRVLHAGGKWIALGVGAPAWTAFCPTRTAAVAAMRAGTTYLDPPTPTSAWKG